MTRQRDILPLPPFAVRKIDPSINISRNTRRRIINRIHDIDWANEGVTSINVLGGHDLATADTHAPPSSSFAALSDIASAYRDVGKPELNLTPDGALAELLRSTSVYSDDRADVKPYAKELVSWPKEGSVPSPLLTGLSVGDRSMLANWKTHMLRNSLDTSHTHTDSNHNHTHSCMPPVTKKAYLDPALFRNASIYCDFLKRLDAAGMIHWARAHGRKGVLGVFFVTKKDGSLRLIFDTRTLNADFADPPHTALPSGAAFGNLECPENQAFVFGSFDIRNAFYKLGIPLDLAERFSLPHISNKHVGNSDFGPSDCLLPCLKVLPMGWSWSLYFCQAYTTNIVARHVSQNRMMLDRCPGVILEKKTDIACAVYVDNIGIGGLDTQTVNSTLKHIEKDFNSLGLGTHEQAQACTTTEFIGLHIDRGHISIKRKRLWRLKFAIECVLYRGACTGKVLEILLGHITWAMLIRRECLSILNHIYSFIRDNRHSYLPIPHSVRVELSHVRALLPLFRTSIHRSWSNLVHTSDASPFGLGVCTRIRSHQEVRQLGRFSERWRFKIEDALKARKSALNLVDQNSFVPDTEALTILANSGLSSFAEVDPSLLRFDDWKVVHGSLFGFKEHITRSEGRALDRAIRHHLRSDRVRGRRSVFLVDNMSLCLALTRGRSSSSALCGAARRVCAHALASNSRFCFRWIPSERNPADGPSRGKRPDGSSWKLQATDSPHVSTAHYENSPVPVDSPSHDHDRQIPPLPYPILEPKPTQFCNNKTHSLESPASLTQNGDDVSAHVTSQARSPASHDSGKCAHRIGSPSGLSASWSTHSHGKEQEKGDCSPCPSRKARKSIQPGASSDDHSLREFRAHPLRIVNARSLFSAPFNPHRLSIQGSTSHILDVSPPPRLDLRHRARCLPGYVPGLALRGGIQRGRWEQAFSRHEVLFARDSPPRKSKLAASCTFSQKLARQKTGPPENPSPLGGIMRDPRLLPSQERHSDRPSVPPAIPDVRTSRCFRCYDCVSACASCQDRGRTFLPLGSDPIPFRSRNSRQDRHLRRCGPPGLRTVVRPLSESTDCKPRASRSSVRPAWVGPSSQAAGSSDSPRPRPFETSEVQPAPRGGQRRPFMSSSIVGGSQETGSVEDRSESSPIWQGDQSPSRNAQDPLKHIGVRAKRIRKPREHVSSKSNRSAPFTSLINKPNTRLTDQQCLALLDKELQHALKLAARDRRRVVLDLYAGTGGVALAIRKLGFACIEFDIKHGPHFDLTRKIVHDRILGWIKSGVTSAVFLATQCTSWSRARRGPTGSSWAAIRSNQHILGMPHLNEDNTQKIKLGNKQMNLTASIIRTCIRLGTPCMLENPVSSMMWRAPPIAHLAFAKCCSSHVLDQCQFGARWRKRTKLLAWHAPTCLDLCKTCTGKHGICSYSHKPHIILQGTCQTSKTLWTKIAQEYPRRLCSRIAAELSNAVEAAKIRVAFDISGLSAR